MKTLSIIQDIIRREGSTFSNHPADKGGPTKFGITQKTLSRYRGYAVSAEEVANLTEPEAIQVYLKLFVNDPKFNQIENEPLAALIVDSGVQHGQKRAARFLQRSIGVKADGIIGPITLRAVNGAKPKTVYKNVLARRIKFYGRIITSNHSQAVFAAGWMNRIAEFIEGEYS